MAGESWVLDGLSLTDGTGLRMEDAEFAPAVKRLEMVTSVDGDGGIPLEEPHVDPLTVTWRLRVSRQASPDAALARIGALVDKLEEAGRQLGGLALVWTPQGSTQSYTLYVLSGQITGVPMKLSGSDFGWLAGRPVLAVATVCKPFLYLPEQVLGTVTSSAPVVTFVFSGVKGDVAAEGRLIVADAVGQARRHVEWGLEQRSYSPGVAKIVDDYSVDTIGQGLYALDFGGTLSVASGQLVPAAVTVYSAFRTDVPYGDVEVTAKHITGTSVAAYEFGAGVKRVVANSHIFADVINGGITLYKRVAGVNTSLGAAAVALAVSTAYWTRLRVVGNVVTGEHWTTDPALGSSPSATITATLTGADAAMFGAGVSGLAGIGWWAPGQLAARVDDLKIRPLSGSTALLIDSDDLVTTGFAGTQATRAGAYDPDGLGNNVIRVTLATQPTAVCSTGSQGHVGTYRVKARVWVVSADSSSVAARLAWQSADGPLSTNRYARAPVVGGFAELDLGLVTVSEVRLGAQSWTGQIQAYSTTVGDTIDVDYLSLIPAGEGYGVARAAYAYQPGALVARDEFTATTAGVALNARVSPAGGTWATSGAPTDFVAADAALAVVSEVMTRSSTAASILPRWAILGATNYIDTEVGIDWYTTTMPSTFARRGLVARWTNANNLLLAQVGFRDSITNAVLFSLESRVASSATAVSQTVSVAAGTWYRLRLVVFASGRAIATLLSGSALLGSLTLTQAALATGGAIATGKPGFFDEDQPTGFDATRYYDNFYVSTPSPEPIALNASRAIEFRHDDTLRLNAAGTTYGRPSSYRGSRCFIPPAGGPGRSARVLVKARRNDIESAADDQIADLTTLEVRYRPRFRIPRGPA